MLIKNYFPPNTKTNEFNVTGEVTTTEYGTFKFKIIEDPKIEIRFKDNIITEINWVYSIILENGTPGRMWERRYTYGRH